MRCDEVLQELSAFLDDELDPVRSRAIQQHVDGCPRCADELARLRKLGGRLRAEAPYHRATDSLRMRATQAAWSQATGGRARVAYPRAPRRAGGAPPVWLRAAAAVVALLGGAWLFTAHVRQEGLASVEREVVSSHVRSLMASHLMDIASTDQHTVKPWFNGRLDFSPPVTDLASSGYPLIGGRLDYLRGRAVAALVYQRGKHWINVFLWPEENTRDAEASQPTLRGYHVIHETHAGMTYWIVSDLNSQELSAFSRLLVASPYRRNPPPQP